MAIERERLLSLVEFAQQSARLRSTPVSSVTQHGIFALYEHQLRGLPGIKVNPSGSDSEDEIWLSVERLHERKPPDITSAVIRPWVQMTQGPNEEPKLKEITDGASLIDAGTHRSSLKTHVTKEEESRPSVDPHEIIALSEYEKAAAVSAQFTTYLETKWRPWAEDERLRRRTIRLYSELFTLKQRLEGGIVEAQLELVWGAGLGIWNCSGVTVGYPIVARLVELSLSPLTAELEVRPRDIDARLEVDWYAAVGNAGVANLEKVAKELFGKATNTFSPFDRGSFEPLLRTAYTNLDPNGVYWPNEVPAEDRSLPIPDEKLKVTDTWVLFARPRTNSLFLQDLEKLKKAVEKIDDPEQYPPAVVAVVTDPDTENPVVELPSFRGVSASYHTESGPASSGKKVRDLYFPKPFNDEQVRIVQLLDVFDGVVVQGPPGTGKTHTIANVICHYLADGKRVLVTSMKDPALAVLQEHLPEEIRPLAISLLTSEQQGMRQFEHAIQKIASEVQGIDRNGTARAINHLEESIDALHGKLAAIDHKINDWAKKNLIKIRLDDEELDPQDAAHEVVDNDGLFEWIPDSLGVGHEFAPQFGDTDVARLREARRVLGTDIGYINTFLPQLIEFPDLKELLQVHQDLSQLELLKRGVANGDVPAIVDSSQETLSVVRGLLTRIEQLQQMRSEVVNARRSWTVALRERLRQGISDDMFVILEALGDELEKIVEERKAFISRPVNIQAGMETDSELAEAIGKLRGGRSPFGIRGLFGKSEQRKKLSTIRVLGNVPEGPEDWEHIAKYFELLKELRELALRWNTLALELHIDTVAGTDLESGLAAAQLYSLYRKVKTAVKSETELCSGAANVFPTWPHSREVADSIQRLAELEKALRHHLTKHRLANVWQVKERFQKVLENKTGRIVDDIRQFLAKTLGNPVVADAE